MEEFTTKQLQRLQRKKAKMAAFLEIARLNDKDKLTKLQTSMQPRIENSNSSTDDDIAMENPSSNRKRKHNEEINNINLKICDKMKKDEAEPQCNKQPRFSSDAYIKLKQEVKERKNRFKSVPKLILKNNGNNAVMNVENIIQGTPIFFSDIQHLLLYSSTSWCKLEKYNKISHKIVLVVEGLSSYHFFANENMFPCVRNNLKYCLEVITPSVYGGSIAEELMAVLTEIHSNQLMKHSLEASLNNNENVIKLLTSTFQIPIINDVEHLENNDENLPSTDKFDRRKLLLSLQQMLNEKYPVPLKGVLANKFSSYVLTKDSYKKVTKTSPIFALDCEMCQTTSTDLELTRISIVDESLNVIYNTLVKPENTIVNYLTLYSGITKEMLADVTITLHDVQQALRTLLPADAILVGHSLNSDLHALKMMHPYNIDTSVIFNLTGHRSRKAKLQTLAHEFLGEKIQTSKAGHCSVEDSKTTMKLVKLKLKNNLTYGDMVFLNHNIQTLKPDNMSPTQKAEDKSYATSIIHHITKNKNITTAIVGSEEIISEYARCLSNSSFNTMNDKSSLKNDQIRLIKTDNNKYAVKRMSEIAMEHDLILCHVKIKDEKLQNEVIEKTLHKVNKWISKMWQCSALNSLQCVIFGGQAKRYGACFLNIKTEL